VRNVILLSQVREIGVLLLVQIVASRYFVALGRPRQQRATPVHLVVVIVQLFGLDLQSILTLSLPFRLLGCSALSRLLLAAAPHAIFLLL